MKDIIPNTKHLIHSIKKRIRFFGRNRYCPICNNHASNFQPFGLDPRKDARCPFCRSLERHRLVWLFFQRKTNLLDPPRKKMLHIAPEPTFAKIFSQEKNIDYLSGDLLRTSAMVKMDITDIKYPNNSFDVLYCSHVLEHIMDDRKAMKELCRVLKPSGWAVLQVPISVEKTFEDPSITDPSEREKYYGKWDHVRRYGQDYEDRLIEAGFNVNKIKATEFTSKSEIEKMRIHRNEYVFFCTKSLVSKVKEPQLVTRMGFNLCE